jgi:hypothetical protein
MPLRTHQRETANLTTIQWDSIGQGRIRTALSAVLYFLVWSYAAVAISSSLATPVGKFDDAIPLLHGMLVQQGHTPNLDFYSFYPPLNLYLNAGEFYSQPAFNRFGSRARRSATAGVELRLPRSG